jgi:hypothetical protein
LFPARRAWLVEEKAQAWLAHFKGFGEQDSREKPCIWRRSRATVFAPGIAQIANRPNQQEDDRMNRGAWRTRRMQWHVAWMGIAVAALAGSSATAGEAPGEWRAADGPLRTQWAAAVAPERVHTEYPRPQMARERWLNLNGLWDYAIAGRDAEMPSEWAGRILVPFPIESALSGVMKRVDEKSRLWYRRTFEIPGDWRSGRVLLHFGAVDWEATVFVNGKGIGVHRGGYDEFSFDITDALKPGGPQEIAVAVFDPTEGGQPRGKQVRKPGGIWYTPSTGIWRTVWLEPTPRGYIADLRTTPDIDAGVLRLAVEAKGVGAASTIEAVASAAGKEVGRASGKPGGEFQIPIKNAHLWSPDDPFLYDLKVALIENGGAVDSVASYFGMRKIALGKDDKGITRLMLNGKFVFHVGPLDQGFWPDGLYTAPTDEALRFDIEMTKKFGFNATRKHVKVEPERWYYWCDKLGLLVWQDMPSSNNRTDEDKKQFERELEALVRTHWNHPSIVMWVVFNEGWGQYDTERLTKWVKELDPSRLVNNASGWTDKKVGDVFDKHDYPGPSSPTPEPDRAAVLGEFGGLGLPVEGHLWTNKSWGYKGMEHAQALTRQYVELLRKVWALKDDPGLCAAIYTQITDVETETNGLMTYDRVVKPDLEKVAAANRGNVPPPPQINGIAPTAQKEPVTWRYTFEKPAEGWFAPDFDASAWKEGPAGFGTKGTRGEVVRTEWKTPDIWIRRTCEMKGELKGAPALLMHHDEDAEVYINGVLVAKVTGFTTDYEIADMNAEGRKALKAGRNVIAVHCRQTSGGQYIDAGVVDVIEPSIK